jgi:hypothetical protein
MEAFMRNFAAGLLVLLVSFVTTAPAQADHPLSFLRPDPCTVASWKHKLSPLYLPKKLAARVHGHFKQGDPGHQPWFHTFKAGPGPESAFPQHPFVRSPRDFFMYEW